MDQPVHVTLTKVRHDLERLHAGYRQAKDLLIEAVQHRLLLLSRRMLRRFPRVQRWEGTDDVLQRALLRLHQSLDEVQPESTRHFFNLAAEQIRRTLIDMARHHAGKDSFAANDDTDRPTRDGHSSHLQAAQAEGGDEPADLEAWTDFHEAVAQLPEDEREIVDLLWYKGLTHMDTAELLAVSTKTIQRCWVAARLRLAEVLTRDES